jgi:hypothetical protein
MSGCFSCEKGSYLRGCHRSILSRIKSCQSQRTKCRSNQFQDKIVEGFKKAADFTISSLCQRDSIPGVGVGVPFGNEFQRNHGSAVKPDVPPSDSFHVGGRNSPLDLHQISPGNGIPRMENSL